MKIAFTTSLLALVSCLGLMVYQSHQSTLQSDRQNQAMALIQARLDDSQKENSSLRMAMQGRERTQVAFTQAMAISAKYAKLGAGPARTAAR